MIIQTDLNDLTERYEDDDESDKHLEARDRRYSCLMLSPLIVRKPKPSLGSLNLISVVSHFSVQVL